MKPINLLPKKSFIEAWFFPLIAVIGAVYILAFIGVTSGTLLLQEQHKRQLEHIENISADIRDAANLRQPDPLSIDFDRYKQLVIGLESSKFDWVPVMDTITRAMPPASRLKSAAYDPEKKQVKLELDFHTMGDAASYVGSIRSSSFFSEVLVSDLSKQVFGSATSAPDESSVPFEEFIPDETAQIPEAPALSGSEDEPDEAAQLLNELESLIIGQTSETPIEDNAFGIPADSTERDIAPQQLTYYSLTVVLSVGGDELAQADAP